MTLTYTSRFHMAVPDFTSEPWHTEFATAMESIDNALFSSIVAGSADLWLNSHAYVIGDLVIDPNTGALYSCAVVHTSSNVATAATMAAERALHPTYWTAFGGLIAASQVEAEAGVENTKYMTALRVAQAIDAQILAPTPIGFSAHKNGTDQTGLVTVTPAKITFGTELYDLGSCYDTTLSRWTPPAGLVNITASIYVPSTVTAGSKTAIHIYKNGVSFKQAPVINVGVEGMVHITIDDNASGTDYYEAYVVGVTGSTYTVTGSTVYSFFMGHVVPGA